MINTHKFPEAIQIGEYWVTPDKDAFAEMPDVPMWLGYLFALSVGLFALEIVFWVGNH
jgi:hypothetical protein